MTPRMGTISRNDTRSVSAGCVRAGDRVPDRDPLVGRTGPHEVGHRLEPAGTGLRRRFQAMGCGPHGPHPLQPHAQRLAGEHDGPPPPRRRHANARATPASEPHVVKRQIKRRPKCENRDVAHWWLHSQVAADGPWWLPSKAAGFRRNSPNGPSKLVRRSNASRAGPMRDTRISARSKR